MVRRGAENQAVEGDNSEPVILKRTFYLTAPKTPERQLPLLGVTDSRQTVAGPKTAGPDAPLPGGIAGSEQACA